MTFERMSPVANVGEIGTQPYNAERNYHASVTYLGDGNWVMFRSVAEPKTTARATGVEQLTSVKDWNFGKKVRKKHQGGDSPFLLFHNTVFPSVLIPLRQLYFLRAFLY